MLITEDVVELSTDTGMMRAQIFRQIEGLLVDKEIKFSDLPKENIQA